MAATKLDAHNARVCDAMILPFKRKIASLIIRSDIWRDDLGPGSKLASTHEETRSRALGAVGEIDEQVTQLSDLKLPGEKKARGAEEEVQKLLASFAQMRAMLVVMAANRATTQAA